MCANEFIAVLIESEVQNYINIVKDHIHVQYL